MAVLEWDKTGERTYETGVDKVVLYRQKDGKYDDDAAAWNGVTGISESPSGADATSLWADNIKYLTLRATEEFGFTIEAYSSPEEFDECDGTATPTGATGVSLGQQPRKTFGLCYRTKIGSDTDPDAGYKLHLIYGATASPSDKSYATINDSPDAMTLSWECDTVPVNVTGHKATSLIVIDSTKVTTAANLTALESCLYGTAATDPYLPLPDEVISLITTGALPPASSDAQ